MYLKPDIMHIILNNQSIEVNDGCTVGQLVALQQLNLPGVAAAVDNKVVPRALWDETELQPNAKVVIIKAVCGG